MDIWNKAKRSEVMSKIRSKNTRPEITLRKFLYKKGLRYRINYTKLPGTPDIVIIKYKTIIFVHGCFWHGHTNCKISHLPKTNTNYWKNKITKNQERDNIITLQLLAMGWKVLTIWECEIQKKNMDNLFLLIEETILKKQPIKFQSVKIYEEIEQEIKQVAEDIFTYNPLPSNTKKT